MAMAMCNLMWLEMAMKIIYWIFGINLEIKWKW